MRLILLGAPGAGKGTQADILSATLNIPTISTGNILRAAMSEGTPTGLKAKEYVESGKLVPDDVIIDIIRERLAEEDCANGYILDGVPRTIPQAEAMEAMGIAIDTALSIEVEDETIVENVRTQDLQKLQQDISHCKQSAEGARRVRFLRGRAWCSERRQSRNGSRETGNIP